MTQTSRRLATIVALDVAGYSARTEQDEAKTLDEVAAVRGVVERLASAHQGRVFNTAGDGFMLEFGSSIAAVEAALQLAETCVPKVRVGVHLGDVAVQSNGDLLGHGVNVAARLMAQAAPGTALVSADVRRTIRGPLGERLQSRGIVKLDKMSESIEAFVVGDSAPRAAAPGGALAEPLLAVLPFDNLSTDPEVHFFSEGMSEEILQAVSRLRGIGVIGRASSFQLRAGDKSPANVARLLKATHLLDGSVRRSGNKVRITAQLVETASQIVLWNARYDRDLTDVFAVQDEIAEAIAGVLDAAIKAKPQGAPLDATTFDLYLRGLHLLRQSSFESMRQAAVLLEQALERQPEFPNALGALSFAYAWLSTADAEQGEELVQKANDLARRASVADPSATYAALALNFVQHPIGNWAAREAQLVGIRRAAPAGVIASSNTGYSSLGSYVILLLNVGRLNDAIGAARRGLLLDPLDRSLMAAFGRALALAGRYDEAIEVLTQTVQQIPGFIYPAVSLVTAAAQAGRFDIVDRLLPNEAAAQSLLGRFARPAQMTAAVLRRPSREGGLQVVATAKRSIDRYGWANFEALALAAHLGAVDEVFEIAEHLHVGVERARSKEQGPDIYLTHGAFIHAYPQIRRDPRFVRLCHKAGLVEYWLATQRWPDCVSEVTAVYDFKAECAKVVAA